LTCHKIILVGLLMFAFGHANSQEKRTLSVHFLPEYRIVPLVLDSIEYAGADGNPITISTFRCYISGIRFMRSGTQVWQEPSSYHLIDASIPGSLYIPLTIPANLKYGAISFNIGIDSLTNVSGAMGGDLDPSKGMYWSWQSGYINLKIEGKSQLSPARNHEFHYHLGGYSGKESSLQTIELNVGSSETVTISADLAAFIDNITISEQYEVMIPGAAAVALSEKTRAIFKIRQ
jgi:hypothetical protein